MKNNFSLLFFFLFLSCEELQVEDLLSDFSDENTPITTISTVDTLFASSTVSLNWTGKVYCLFGSIVDIFSLKPTQYKAKR